MSGCKVIPVESEKPWFYFASSKIKQWKREWWRKGPLVRTDENELG